MSLICVAAFADSSLFVTRQQLPQLRQAVAKITEINMSKGFRAKPGYRRLAHSPGQ